VLIPAPRFHAENDEKDTLTVAPLPLPII
jgi:hypothetical protein